MFFGDHDLDVFDGDWPVVGGDDFGDDGDNVEDGAPVGPVTSQARAAM
ncbi:MAG: hypothetical protein WBH39_14100 [Candidatus Microthrix parvicella]